MIEATTYIDALSGCVDIGVFSQAWAAPAEFNDGCADFIIVTLSHSAN